MGSRIGTMYIMCFFNFKSFLKERKKSFNRMPYDLFEMRTVNILFIRIH